MTGGTSGVLKMHQNSIFDLITDLLELAPEAAQLTMCVSSCRNTQSTISEVHVKLKASSTNSMLLKIQFLSQSGNEMGKRKSSYFAVCSQQLQFQCQGIKPPDCLLACLAFGALVACRKDLEGVDVLYQLLYRKHDAHACVCAEEEDDQEEVEQEDGLPIPVREDPAAKLVSV